MPTNAIRYFNRGRAYAMLGLPAGHCSRIQFADRGLCLRASRLAQLNVSSYVKCPVDLGHNFFVRLVDVNWNTNLGP